MIKRPTGYWGQQAFDVIAATIASARAEGLSYADTVKRIDAAYPFGERKYYAYKAWLKERRRALGTKSRRSVDEQPLLLEVRP